MTPEEYAAGTAGKIPRHLYKYKSLAGPAGAHTRDLVVNQNLYFPAPADLNDPFECKPHLATVATPEQQRRYMIQLVKRISPEKSRVERKQIVNALAADRLLFRQTMFRATQATLDAAGIYSLSARPRDLLMWPHYADNHRGVCVRFDMQALLDAKHVPFPVIYADQRPACDTILEETVDWLNKAVLTKGRPWEYEQEWRLVVNRGARSVLPLFAPTIDGVLLGANISAANRADVLQWAADARRTVVVAQARFHPTSYELVVDDLP